MENLNNYARPESALEISTGYPCQECGTLCKEEFCCLECQQDFDTHDDFTSDPDEDGCPEEMEFEDDGQPTMYEEYQDLYGGDDWDHGQYDSEY